MYHIILAINLGLIVLPTHVQDIYVEEKLWNVFCVCVCEWARVVHTDEVCVQFNIN